MSESNALNKFRQLAVAGQLKGWPLQVRLCGPEVSSGLLEAWWEYPLTITVEQGGYFTHIDFLVDDIVVAQTPAFGDKGHIRMRPRDTITLTPQLSMSFTLT